MNLGVSSILNLTLNAASDYTGNVSLTIDRTNLDAVDVNGRVGTTLSMATAHLTPGSSTTIPVMLTTSTQAPDFSSDFKVTATSGGVSSSTTVNLQVLPVYDVYLHGGTTPGSAPEVWDAAQPAGTVTNFAPHTSGVTIHFINMDMRQTHIIHGNGDIPHQNTGMPLAPSPGAGMPGGTYTVTETGTTVTTGSFYCHSHESSAEARPVQTNTP
jgi:hypothetical protein